MFALKIQEQIDNFAASAIFSEGVQRKHELPESDRIMNLDQTLSDLTSLSVNDRLRVVESLWDSIESAAPLTIAPNQQAEIDRRVAAHDKNPAELLTWDEVLDQLRDDR